MTEYGLVTQMGEKHVSRRSAMAQIPRVSPKILGISYLYAHTVLETATIFYMVVKLDLTTNADARSVCSR